ncbi:hypothetical protein F441_15070 [Phytophthora nicotianae CJ01A1]|uniref:RxLR effector protein n=7 Tax=Phytophthora nicotianae TaxID=4792 RepID=W2PT44_PHYN3|nr:hypothetical protein PPTG_15977 [Phytophthora nicotianae INRA-310]ETI39114.1 hypothetical protein F443_15259 [Phytophthora nicotianae P1569]ETK79314.1 hypothetical protein L915_14801 [Phytophthora nicotianae]ETO67854.1 hypothetical protein F444_15247 [Phytophthora nicotianae P1976]ETP09016.1 hypothetical protein F441_15070 [Phytophthora nicotianae CJ01A1]ETP37047.1 hypothetical protein F442_15097 [Phytophthora nicotianae P10297]KUF89220.1 hypothetical protein AM588_10002142 [Phytophthora n
MRFYYIVFAVTATLLASTNAVSTDAQHNQISQSTSEIVAATQIDVSVKRSLRSSKYIKEEEDTVDSLDDTEERRGGVLSKNLMKIVKERNTPIAVNIAKLNPKQQEKIVDILYSQSRTLEYFAKKLGLRSAADTTHRNSPFFQAWSSYFLNGKKPKKIPEIWI